MHFTIPASPTDRSCSTPQGYRSTETQMQIEDKMVNLAPGMATTVEMKTGTRRIIEYLMSPSLRYKQESLRER